MIHIGMAHKDKNSLSGPLQKSSPDPWPIAEMIWICASLSCAYTSTLLMPTCYLALCIDKISNMSELWNE